MLSVLFVNDDAAPGGDGLSWGSAFDDLQGALERATTLRADGDSGNDVDQIWIAEGVYKPSAELEPGIARSASFSLVDGVTLYGGFSGTETTLAERDWSAHETVLSGDIGVVDNASDNAYTVVYCTESTDAGVDGLSITRGNANGGWYSDHLERNNGAGIYSAGVLTVANSTISSNWANVEGEGGGIYNAGTLTITDSTLSENLANVGGGIYSYGVLSVTDCLLSCNSAGAGGGIRNRSGTLTVTNSTLSGNWAEIGGAAIENYDTLTVTNSTLVGNATGGHGAGIESYVTLTVTNSTLAYNSAVEQGGGISAAGKVTLNNSILWRNGGGDLEGLEKGISAVRNLIGIDPRFVRDPSDGGDGWGDDPHTLGVDESANDDFGDLRLTAESPAVDYGDVASAVDAAGNPLATDLEGNLRVYGTAVDVGAYEFQGNSLAGREAASLTVTTAEDVFDLYDDQVSLREAIYYAGADSQGTTIIFDGALDGATITLAGAALYIDRELSVDASSLTSLTVDADKASRVFAVIACDEDAVALSHLAITGGLATFSGGGIHNSGTLTITDSTLASNAIVRGSGGGIFSTGALTITNSTIESNAARLMGGGVYNSGTLTVENSTLVGNVARSTGGAIHNYVGTLTVTNSTITDNVAEIRGGAIYNKGEYGAGVPTVTVTGSTLSGNSVSEWGGGICNASGSVTVTNSMLVGNSAGKAGGGIFTRDDYNTGAVTLTNSTLSGNSAMEQGGGIHNYSSDLTFNNTIIAENAAPQSPDIYQSGGSLIGSHNLIGDGTEQTVFAKGTDGNLVGTSEHPVDPLFLRAPSHGGDGWGDDPDTPDIDESANDDYGDLQLQPGSPAIDAGDNALAVDATGAPLTTDLFGNPRILDGNNDGADTVDMGALEYVPPTIPAFDPISEITVDEHTPVDFLAQATDPEDPLTYALVGAPDGAAIDADTGQFTWTPGEADGPGDFAFQISATDTAGDTGYVDVTVHVQEVNEPPVLDCPTEFGVVEWVPVWFQATATDPDLPAQELTFSLAGDVPQGAVIMPENGWFDWGTNDEDGPGKYTFEIRVTDEMGLSDSVEITIYVSNEVNSPHVIDPIIDPVVDEHEPVELTVTVTDIDMPPQPMRFDLAPGAPDGAVVDLRTGRFTWTPGEEDGPGDYPIEIIVTDDASLSVATQFTIHVNEINALPALDEINEITLNENESVTFTATATDADLPAQRMVFSLGSGAPAGAAIDPLLGHFHWTPGETHGPGDYTFKVYVLDDMGGRTSQDVTIHVLEVNEPPVLDSIGTLTVNEHEPATFTATATDADVPIQSLTYSLGANAPTGATIDPDTGEFSWTPGEADGPGEFTFQVIATDDAGASDAVDVTIHVAEVNEPPVLDCGTEGSIPEWEALMFTVTATDPDLPAQELTFSLAGDVPAGAGIMPDSGWFIFDTDERDGPGAYTFQVCVTDEMGLSDSVEITIYVSEVNEPHLIDPIGDLIVDEHETVDLTITVDDIDLPEQAMTFALGKGAPAGAAIDPDTGEFTWTPGEADGPGVYPIEIVVTDEYGLAETTQFSIHVNEVDEAPVFDTIDEITVDEHETVAFMANATDPDLPAQTLTYSLGSNAPAGATIHPVTGQFLWTPEETDGPGDFTFQVVATDSLGASTATDITIHVLEVNEPPVLEAIRSRDVFVGRTVAFTAAATDVDLPAQTLMYALGAGAPNLASFDPNTGEFDWTPRAADLNQTFTFEVVAIDPAGGYDAQTVSLSVIAPNGETEYVVTSLGDVIADDGWVTLREALTAANTNAPVGDVRGGSENVAETITFDPALFAGGPAVLSMKLGGFRITEDVYVVGPGPGILTIDAHGGSRVLYVAADTTAVLSGVTLTGGTAYDGGAVYNTGILTLEDVALRENTAQRGGAIYNHLGRLTIRDGVLSGNSASEGGAICDYRGNLSIIGTEFSANTAAKNGGAVHLEGSGTADLAGAVLLGNTAGYNGGGIFNAQGDLALTGVLMHGNTAAYNGGAIHNLSGRLFVGQSTISGNTAHGSGAIGSFGGGIYNGTGTLELTGSLVTHNTADVAPDVSGFGSNLVLCDAIVGDVHYRLVDEAVETETIDPAALFIGDPFSTLQPLVDLRLAPDSPAVDAADPATLPGDRYDLDADGDLDEPLPVDVSRGPRVLGSGLDLGAFEFAWNLDDEPEAVALPGDLNGDGVVNTADLDLVRAAWGRSVPSGDPLQGDPSGDGVVGADDLDIVRANWGNVPAAAADAVFGSLGADCVYGPRRREEAPAIKRDPLSSRQIEFLAWEAWNRERSRLRRHNG